MINSANVMGRLTADPELRQTTNGVSVVSFSIANEYNKKTNFFRITAWRANAEFVCKYFHKGSMIAVTGHMDNTSYEDKNGNKKEFTEVVADSVSFCGSKKEETTDTIPAVPQPNTDNIPDDDENDLPF